MTVPLVVLAVITCVAGFIPFGDFISSDGEAYTIHLDGGVVAISLTVAIAAIALATWMYLRAKQPVADRLATTFSGLHKAAYHRFYNACRIKDAEPAVRDARLTLCLAAKQTIENVLKLIGVDAPESM